MDPSELYDIDFVAWTEQQAAALRRMPPSNSLDLDHLAEEIESLGKRDLREVQSLLRQIILHLLKIAWSPEANTIPHWKAEVLAFQADARDAFAPSMAQKIDLADIWRSALNLFLQAYSELGQLGRLAEAVNDAKPDLRLDAYLKQDFQISTVLPGFFSCAEKLRKFLEESNPEGWKSGP
jgi:hypothetical protein